MVFSLIKRASYGHGNVAGAFLLASFAFASTIQAADKILTLGGTNVSLQDITAQVDVFYSSMRFNRASRAWNVEATLTNHSNVQFQAPLVLMVESYTGTSGPIQADGKDPQISTNSWYDLSAWVPNGVLGAAQSSAKRTLTLGYASQTETPRLGVRIFALAAPITRDATAVTHTLDENGLPLGSVTVLESGPGGQRTITSDRMSGLATLGTLAGEYTWKFTATNCLAVWRKQTLYEGEVAVIPSPRLVRKAAVSTPIDTAEAAVVKTMDESVTVTFPAGSFGQPTTATLSPVSGQILPGLLPKGWSPLQGFALELTSEPLLPASAQLRPIGPMAPSEIALLARWNPNTLLWDVLASTNGSGSSPIFVAVALSGTYVLAVADTGTTAPPAPQTGSVLQPSDAPTAAYTTLTAGGTVKPLSRIASRTPELVTAQAQVYITNSAGALPSGIQLRCLVREHYELRDGTHLFLPPYEHYVVGYHRPKASSPQTLYSEFPTRPVLLFGADELMQATIQTDVLPPAVFTGGIIDSGGGQLGFGAVRILAAPGDLTARQAVRLEQLEPTNFLTLVKGEFPVVGAFDLDVSGVAPGRRLALQFSGLQTNSFFVLASVKSQSGLYGLEPLERLVSSSSGVLTSIESGGAEALPGITGPGRYLLVKVASPQGLIMGVARNALGIPAQGLPVRIDAKPWLTFSSTGGVFKLVAPVGAISLNVTDILAGNTGTSQISVADPAKVTSADLGAPASGPRIVSITPTNGATSVPRVASVVIKFNKPVNPSTLVTGGIQLLDAASQPIAATASLNLQNTTVTLLPNKPLPALSQLTVSVSTNIADAAGLPLEGIHTFSFTTETDALLRDPRAQLISYEPVNGIAGILGTTGLADPESPVIIVNETSSRTATVLSKPDGSFTNSMQAEVDDRLSVVLVNRNRSTNSVGLSRQVFRDGSIGLFSGGGVIESQGENGPVQLIVEPGSIPGKTRFKVEALPLAQLKTQFSNAPPESSLVVGGFKYSQSGDKPTLSPDVSLPVKLEDLGLQPGESPTNCGFALVVPRTIDGVQVYQVIDRMHYENGRLVTHSAPFLGLLSLNPVNPLGYMVEELFTLAIRIAVASQPTSIAGRVYSVETAPGTATGLPKRKTGTERYLRGAIVSYVIPGLNSPRGRLRPGMVMGVTDADGRYAMLVDSAYVDAPGGMNLHATHPWFPGTIAQGSVPVTDPAERSVMGNLLSPIDIVFEYEEGLDKFPPAVAPAHTPLFPAVGSNAVLTVLATGNKSAPTVTVSVDSVRSLDPKVAVATSDVTLTTVGTEALGSYGIRQTNVVTCPKAAQVVLAIDAVGVNGLANKVSYPIMFGAIPPQGTNFFLASDVNDHTGPRVMETQPSMGSSGLAPGSLIRIRFSKAISRDILVNPGWIVSSPSASPPTLALDESQRVLSVGFPDLRPGTVYSFTLGTGIEDLLGNQFDQDSTTTAVEPCTFSLTTTPAYQATLPGVTADPGAGAVILGGYGFLLESHGYDYGRLSTYDLSDPRNPVKVCEYNLPQFPRDLVLIPQYSFVYTNGTDNPITTNSFSTVLTRNLIVAVGGALGGGQFSWMRIIDVTDPTRPQRFSGGPLDLSGQSTATRVRWSAPVLGILETGNPDHISLINLQEYLIGDLLAYYQDEYMKLPAEETPGVDSNGDGDYVDAGERPPLPARRPIDFAGKIALLTVPETDQTIWDMTVDRGGAYVGVILDRGREYPPGSNVVNSCYRTLLDRGLMLERELSSVELTNAFPRRLTTLFNTQLVISNQLTIADLAVCSLVGDTGGTNLLVVIDVTDPLNPSILTEVPLPKTSTNPGIYGAELRSDGLLLVAVTTGSFLLDPSRFAETWLGTGTHPAIVSNLEGMGGSRKTFGATGSGVNLSASVSSRPIIVQAAPALRFISFPTNRPFAPSTLVDKSDQELDRLFEGATYPDYLEPSQYRPITSNPKLADLDARFHYYVLLEAPGGAGTNVDLALEGLNAGGYPMRKRGFLFPPVQALSSNALQSLVQMPGSNDAPVRAASAYRLSTNQASPYYNFFLSRPVVLVAESMSTNDLAKVQNQLDREVLWSPTILRASIDPGMSNNPVIGAFAGRVDLGERVNRPGVQAFAECFPGDYLQSLNPSPISGAGISALTMNSVSPNNSEMKASVVDAVMPGRRMPLEFRRTYASQGLYDGPFGRGWDFNFNQRILEMPDHIPYLLHKVDRGDPAYDEEGRAGDLLFYTGGGRVIVYKYAGNAAPPEIASDPLIQNLGWLPKAARFYQPPPGVFTPMLRFKDGRYVRLEPDGRQFWYDTRGRLSKIYDRYESNSIELIYNTRGELVAILDDLKRRLELGYWRSAGDTSLRHGIDSVSSTDEDIGRVSKLVDPCQRDTLFYYSSDGVLERCEGPEVRTAFLGGFKGRYVTRYGYSDASKPDRTGRSLVSVTGQEAGGTATLAVSSQGDKGRDTVNGFRLGSLDFTISQTHSNDASAMAKAGGTMTIQDSLGFVQENRIDKLGRLTNSVIRSPRLAPLTTQTEYYPNGLVKKVVLPEGNSVEYFYDESNPSLRSRGNCIRMVRDPGPRAGVKLEATASFDPWYNLQQASIKDFDGSSMDIALSPDHRDVERIVKGGEKETFAKSGDGQLSLHVGIDGVETGYDYTSDGFILTEKLGGRAVKQYDYSGSSTSLATLGLPTKIKDAEGIETSFIYDELGRLGSVKRAGSEIQYGYDESGNLAAKQISVETNRVLLTTYAYTNGAFLREQRIKDVEVQGGKADLVAVFEPDAFNRTKSILRASGEFETFAYDDLGRVVTNSFSGRAERTFEYDGNGNVVKARVGPDEFKYVYDGHDRLVQEMQPGGAIRDLALDGGGRVLTNRLSDASGAVLRETSTTYDALGREKLKQLRRNNDVVSARFDYDTSSRTETFTDAGGVSQTTYYDQYGMPSKVTHPNYEQTFTYDRNGRLVQRLTKESDLTTSERWGYNERNQMVSETDNAGNERQLSVDLDGRVTQTVDREHNTNTTEFTLLGEVLQTTNGAAVTQYLEYDQGRHFRGVSDAATHKLVERYDTLGRLVATDLPNGQTTVYDDFNGLGQPQRLTMPRGVSLRNSYDSEGHITNRVVHSPLGDRNETFGYDAAGRLQSLSGPFGSAKYYYDLSGFVRQTDYSYSFQNAPTTASGFSFSLLQAAYPSGFRLSFEYPNRAQALTYNRDVTGRLLSLNPAVGEPIISSTTWLGEARQGEVFFGSSRVKLEITYDSLRRVAGRRYTSLADGSVLLDLCYAFDKNGAVLGRQDAHRAGRADFFRYDSAQRLVRVDRDARPSTGPQDTARPLTGFTAPLSVTGDWKPGSFAREFSYSPTDVLTHVAVWNPNGLVLPLQVQTFSGQDELLFSRTIDGVSRDHDEVGNTTNTVLAARLPGSSDPVLLKATLFYDDLGQLIRVDREDGVKVYCEYDAKGYRIRRVVTGDPARCVPSDLAFVYDDLRLIEERDLLDGGRVVRRFYYADQGDELVAADMYDGTALQRYYFLVDGNRSVRGLADSKGASVERVQYDAFGQPDLELADKLSPAVSRIVFDTNSLLIQFTEAIAPGNITSNAPGVWTASWPDLVSALQVTSAGLSLPGKVLLAEDVPAGMFGATLRFIPDNPLPNLVQVTVRAAGLRDEWGNSNSAESFSFDLGTNKGPVVVSSRPAGSTAAKHINYSSVGSALLFHGQYFDYETGLLYCRSRYYDAFSSTFLQRDPVAYGDSVNHYAAFAHNPVSYRDATGQAVESAWLGAIENFGKELQDAGSQADYQKDGLVGWVAGEGMKLAGSLLRTRAIFAEAQATMEKGGGGTIGVMNAMRGADVMIGQTKLVSTVALSLARPMFQAAGRVGGQFKGAARRIRAGSRPPGPMVEPMTMEMAKMLENVQGWATAEGRGSGIGLNEYINVKGANSIELGVRQIAASKRAFRVLALRVFDSIYQKGTTIMEKTPFLGTGTFKRGYLKKVNGVLKRVEEVQHFVPDIDIAWVKVDGRFVSEQEVLELCKYLNKGVREAWAKEGRAGVPSRPYRHGAHKNLPEHFGDTAPGTLMRYDNHYFDLAGGPKGVFTLSLNRGGNVVYQVAPKSVVRQFVHEIFEEHPHVFANDPALRAKWLEELE